MPRKPSLKASTHSPRFHGRRSTGLLVALAFALIGAGVVLFVALSNPSKPGSTSRSDGRVPGEGPDEPTDITSVGGTTDARIQVVDKKRPGRVSSDFLFRRLNPIGGGAYDVTEPRAFIYLVDGRTIYVRSDTGRIILPSQSDAPESGEFTGNGLVLVFPRREPGDARPIDVETDTPGMIARFTAASFDTVLLEVSTRDDVFIETPESAAVLHGALVRGNQAEERLEYAKIGPGEFRSRVSRDENDSTQDPGRKARAEQSDGGGEAGAPTTARAERLDTDAARVEPGEAATNAATDSASGVATKTLKEDLYRAIFTGDVTLVQATRTLTSDTLTVWSRFIDGKLPEGALGAESETSRRTRQSAGACQPAPARSVSMPLAAALPLLLVTTTQTPRSLFSPRETDVILTWKKDLIATPIAPSPPPKELAGGNHVHARFNAEQAGGLTRVGMSDSEIGAVGACGILDYAATTRQLTMTAGSGIDRVDFAAPNLGRMVGPSLSFNLGSGVGQIRGAGELISLKDDRPTVLPPPSVDDPLPESAQRRIRWSDQADFELFTRDGQAEDVLKEARFSGEVLAQDHWSCLWGDVVAASFDRRELPGGKSASNLSRLRMTGRGVAIGGPSPKRGDDSRPLPPLDSCIAGDSIDIRFQPARDDDRQVEPTGLLASGDVRISDRKSELHADRVMAELTAGPGNRTGVGSVVAESADPERLVRIERADGVWATAGKLVASGDERWADLTGNGVALGRGDGSVIRGEQAHLEETTGLLHIFGPGSFDHAQPGASSGTTNEVAPGSEPTHIRATWTRSMVFENSTGRIECHGDAEVNARSTAEGRVARCERLLLNITPAPEEQASAPYDTGPGIIPGFTAEPQVGGATLTGLDERQLLSAEMIGAVNEREDGALASIKAWTLGASDGSAAPQYQRVLYLEGAKLLDDELSGRISVPGAGRGLIFDAGTRTDSADLQNAASPTGGPAESLGSTGAAGDTRFTWSHELVFQRAAPGQSQGSGQLLLKGDVELEHLPLGAKDKITIRCADLTADFQGSEGGNANGTMRSALCQGGAYAESGTQTLTADEFSYDSAADTLIAISRSDIPVTLNDSRRAAPVLARRLLWNRATDRIEVQEPMPVTGPLTK